MSPDRPESSSSTASPLVPASAVPSASPRANSSRVTSGSPAETASTASIVRRYALFQLPEAGAAALVLMVLVSFDVLSPGLAWLLFALWIGKEIAFFPLMRRAYEPSSVTGTATLIGATGVVTAPLGENGFVRVGPELWRARPARQGDVPPVGCAVRIESVEGYTVFVSALTEEGCEVQS